MLVNPSSGSSTPGLPAWTFHAATMAAGRFVPNAATMATTGSIQISTTAKNGDADWGSTMGVMTGATNVVLCFVDSTGRPSLFNVTGVASDSGFYTFTVSVFGSQSGSWSGDYQLSFIPVVPNGSLMAVDTGWIAPEGAGTKAASLMNYSMPGFGGSDTVSQAALEALGDKVAALNAWAQAIQTALASRLYPNA